MKEQNKKTLIEALSSLPEYEPPKTVWENIEVQMDLEELYPKEQLRQLPDYSPPSSVWQKIAQSLEARPAGSAKVVALTWKKVLAVAASVALVAFAIWQVNLPSKQADEFSVFYSTETMDTLLLAHDWDEDETAFQEFLEICQTKKFTCSQPEFQQLQNELEELTQAKESLKEAIGGYGANPGLVLQIKEIELERTDVLKKMMVMLI